MYSPYDMMPRITGPDGRKLVCAPGNLQASIDLARWHDAGSPGDFFEWLSQQEPDDD